jgi:hypothetical protein
VTLRAHDSATLLARFRPWTVLGPGALPPESEGRCFGVVDVGRVRVIALDSRNPNGGTGGSIGSDQCGWLVRQLELSRNRYVVVASQDSSFTMVNRAVVSTLPPRVLGMEIVSILLAHANVVAWVTAQIPLLAEQRHGHLDHGFWELAAWSGSDAHRPSVVLEVRQEGVGREQAIVIRRAEPGAHPAGAVKEWRLPDPLAGGLVTPGARTAPAAARC